MLMFSQSYTMLYNQGLILHGLLLVELNINIIPENHFHILNIKILLINSCKN